MTWNSIPKDDAWRQVSLAYVHASGQRIWIHCACGRQTVEEPLAYAQIHDISPDTPLLSIARRLRCSQCGERRVQVWPEPYSIERRG